jgi:hypothetical protein
MREPRSITPYRRSQLRLIRNFYVSVAIGAVIGYAMTAILGLWLAPLSIVGAIVGAYWMSRWLR